MGTRVPRLCPGTTFFQQINFLKKKISAYITNQIASKKVKPRGTGSSDKKKFQKVIDKNVRWWAPGYPVVHIRVMMKYGMKAFCGSSLLILLLSCGFNGAFRLLPIEETLNFIQK